MADASALSQLRDIHLPIAVSWWPLAPGWWLLGFILMVTVIGLIVLGKRHFQRMHAKRQALQLLKQYQQEYVVQKNVVHSASQISMLLRRVALAYFPRQQVAGLQGREWIDFLNKHSKQVDFSPFEKNLLQLPYQNNPTDTSDLNDLFKQAANWIKQRGKRCSV